MFFRVTGWGRSKDPVGAGNVAAAPAEGSGPRRTLASLRYILSGEGWGKLTGAGLHVLSDLPILDVKAAAYSACAGFDCLANKGVMLVRVALNDAPVRLDPSRR